MILQRNTTVSIWGWADSGEEITIHFSWLNESEKVVANKEGRWEVKVATSDSRNPQVIEIEAGNSSIVLDDILFGEVWLCSGQSNMEQPIKGFRGQPVFKDQLDLATTSNPNIRFFSVEKEGEPEPLDDLKTFKPWRQASPENLMDFSAIAYFLVPVCTIFWMFR